MADAGFEQLAIVSIAAATPPFLWGTPASSRPISTPVRAPRTVSSFVSPRVADAEGLACKLVQAGAERHVEGVEHELTERVGVMAFGHENGRDGRRIVTGVTAVELEAPGANGAAGRFGEALVTREHVLEAFLVDHVDSFCEAVEKAVAGV